MLSFLGHTAVEQSIAPVIAAPRVFRRRQAQSGRARDGLALIVCAPRHL